LSRANVLIFKIKIAICCYFFKRPDKLYLFINWMEGQLNLSAENVKIQLEFIGIHIDNVKIKKQKTDMKKYVLVSFLALLFFHCSAQVGNTGWDGITRLGTVPQGNSSLSIEAYKEKSCDAGADQWGEIIIKNLSPKRYLLEFDVSITTTCGNEVSQHFSMYLDGNDQQFGARAVMYTHAKACAGIKVGSGTMLTSNQYDRIRSVGFKNLTATQRELSTGSTGLINTDQSQTTRASSTSNTYTPPRTTTSNTYTPPKTYTPPPTTTTTNPLSDAINTLGNSLIQMQQERARQREEEYARQEQASKEKMEREEAEREERQQREREQQEQLQRERDAGRADRNADFAIDMQLGASYYSTYSFKKPSSIETEHPNIKTMYYLAYCHMDNVVTIMPPLTINKYSDDSWLLTENLMAKITPLFGYTIKEFDGGISANKLITLGYFTDAATANAAFNTIKQNAVNKGYTVHLTAGQKATSTAPAPSKPTNKPNSKDFWSN
jgi:hypothetical protein